MQTLTKTDLDAWKCPCCAEDDHSLPLWQECCGGAPLYAYYDKQTSRLMLECANCKQEVFHIVL